MQRTRVKFCGITRVEDAVAAARAGADAIGMVFYSASSRRVTMEQAQNIMAALPPFVTPVGLFVDSSVEEIREMAGRLHLRHIQLHGNEEPELVRQLDEFVVLKAIRVQRNQLATNLSPWRQAMPLANLGGILLETHSSEVGGSGIENDWSAIRAAQQLGQFENLPPMIAAGGLTPGNVGAVVRQIRPWAVDVSSGIESSRGIKSVEKMERFIAAVRGADEGLG